MEYEGKAVCVDELYTECVLRCVRKRLRLEKKITCNVSIKMKYFSKRRDKQEMNIYYIGGSPCAGKSSVAEILSQKYGLYYFKADDFLDRYIQAGAQSGYPICKKTVGMNVEQI